MKIYLGKYVSYLNVYKITDRLGWLGFSEDSLEKAADWLVDNTPLQRVLDRVNEMRPRRVSVRIDEWDTWSADHTMSTIIHPLLVKLSEHDSGIPAVDMEDVPETLRHVYGTDSGDEEWERDSLFWMKQRWNWVLGEMIFAHASIIDDSWAEQFHHGPSDIDWVETGELDENGDMLEQAVFHKDSRFDREGYQAYSDRIDNGLRLFGKYYRSLWT